jgi:magnesium transporter
MAHGMSCDIERLDQPVKTVVRPDVATLSQDLTVEQALDAIRRRGIGEKIVYFYAVDDQQRLVGVLPTRRLLTAPLEQRIAELMITRVVALPQNATVLDACEAFVLHRFLALPVVDDERRIIGVVDVGLLSDEAFDIAEREHTDALFESIGFHVAQVRDATPVRAFRFRFPWLLATIGSGLVCAMLAIGYEATLQKSLVLSFFLTLVLGLGESVGMQSMTVTIQSLRARRPTWTWYLGALRREMGTSLLLGLACGTLVAFAVVVLRRQWLPAATIGGSIAMSLAAAAFLGLSVPATLHALRLDPKIAAGPMTLALADIFTLLTYFTLAALVL